MAFCTQCGHRPADGSKFCNECGSPVGLSQGLDDISLNVEITIRVVLKGESNGNTETEVYLPHLGKTVAVRVPNNISIGQTLRLRGLGHTSHNGEKGDAYIRIVQIDYDNTAAERKETQRKVYYEGELRKCPQCGEVLTSFTAFCPSCGLELRGANVANSVKALAQKLEEIEKQRIVTKAQSLLKRFLKQGTPVNAVDEQKISLIRSFSIPNTKEDILEFMILASSNIDMKVYGMDSQRYQMLEPGRRELSDAWLAKLDQAYEKAKFVFGTTPEFISMQTMYEKKMRRLKLKKFELLFIVVGLFAFLILECLIISLFS